MSTTRNCWTCGWNVSGTSYSGRKYFVCVHGICSDIDKWEKLTPFDGKMPKNKNTLRRCPGWLEKKEEKQ